MTTMTVWIMLTAIFGGYSQGVVLYETEVNCQEAISAFRQATSFNGQHHVLCIKVKALVPN